MVMMLIISTCLISQVLTCESCDMVHVQYGVASDDSQNDCTLDEHDSASSDMCRMSPFPNLVSTTAA